jgi:hypothetical protein
VVAISTMATSALKVTVRSSLVAGNPYGFISQSNALGSVSVAVSNSTVSQASTYAIGVLNQGAKVWVSGNTVTHSLLAFVNSGGVFESAGTTRCGTTARMRPGRSPPSSCSDGGHLGAIGNKMGVLPPDDPSSKPREKTMQSRSGRRILASLATMLLLSTPAQALVFRAYVASDGSDANPCTLPQPCRLLPAALTAVADGGEIWMLDSANYNTGTVVVAKSVSILAVPGAIGSMVAAGGPAISIAATGLTVALRNVVVVPLPGAGGTNGVTVTGASSLVIEDSVFANLANAGWKPPRAGSGSRIRRSGT